MNYEEREGTERFREIQDNTSELRSREIRILFEELRREENQEMWDKIVTTIRYHQFEQRLSNKNVLSFSSIRLDET